MPYPQLVIGFNRYTAHALQDAVPQRTLRQPDGDAPGSYAFSRVLWVAAVRRGQLSALLVNHASDTADGIRRQLAYSTLLQSVPSSSVRSCRSRSRCWRTSDGNLRDIAQTPRVLDSSF